MTQILMLLRLEGIKLKGTLALALAFVSPATVVVLNTLVFLQRDPSFMKPGTDAWLFFCQQVLVLWSLLMMPLFVTLETALLAGLENQEGHWRQILCQPVARWKIFAAKGLAAWCLFFVSLLALYAMTMIAGFLLMKLRPAMAFHDFAVPWLRVPAYLGLSLLSAGLIIGIHQWLALRSRNFVLPLGFGMIMTVAGMLIINSSWRVYYPWAMPGIVMNGFISGIVETPSVWAGLIGGCLFGALAVFDLSRREVI